jgi:putative DNA primase/helicase
MKLELERLPQELKEQKCWICWRLEPKGEGEKPDKVPYNPVNGKKAMSNNPATWGSFQQAVKAMEKFGFSGLGFVFSKVNSYVGVDIDNCRNPETGELTAEAQDIVDKLSSYTEISPSGKGIHIIVKGELPKSGRKNSRTSVEMYESGRYFTMTGNRLPGTPSEVAERTEALQEVHSKYILGQRKKGSKARDKKGVSVPLSDEAVLQKAKVAQNGEEFALLWEGNWQERYDSQSEADLALCMHLAFWTGRNREQMDRLFRQSKLYREKWDKAHYADGRTYGEEVLAKAAENTEECYSPVEDKGSIMEKDGRYLKLKGDGSVLAISNFVIRPIEIIEAEEEAQVSAEVINDRGESFRRTFLTTEFGNLQKFKNVLNQNTLSLCYTGTESDLELLKNHISKQDCQRKKGVRGIGCFEYEGRWVFVGEDRSVDADGNEVPGIVSLKKTREIKTKLLDYPPVDRNDLQKVGRALFEYNEPAKTVSIIGFCAGCFLKEKLRTLSIKFPHLVLTGEQGSGKSNTLERFIIPIFSTGIASGASKVTPFTVMKASASSNLVPQLFDEFKPSTMDKYRLETLYNHLRDAYDGHDGQRGRPDLSVMQYRLSAPIVLVGEGAPAEPAIRERCIELLFNKKDLKDAARRRAFSLLSRSGSVLGRLGRSLLNQALKFDMTKIKSVHEEASRRLEEDYPSRVANNLACCVVGLRLVEEVCSELGLTFEEVSGMTMVQAEQALEFGAKEYLLDGGTYNKSVIDLTFEIFDRMGLAEGHDYTFVNNGAEIGFDFKNFYDRYTKYRREHAIGNECLEYGQFIRQLKHKEYFKGHRAVRFEDGIKKAWVIDMDMLAQSCDVSNLENTRDKLFMKSIEKS